MMVTVKMFAAVRDAVGASEVQIDVPEDATIADVRAALSAAYPPVSQLVSRTMFAMNARYARDNEVIRENVDLACIPPVSGG